MFIVVEAWITGLQPMLQNRATEEALSGQTRTNNAGERETPRDQAARCLYRIANDGGQIAVPGGAIARMLREAGGSHKSKGSRKSLKFIVPAAVIVMDDLCGLYLPDRKTPIVDFEVDSRPVTIPATKGRIMRHRARFERWSLKVTLRINTDILAEAMIRQLMAEGIQQIGIGDFRPEKGGPFGIGSVTSWSVLDDRAHRSEHNDDHASGRKRGRPRADELRA